MLIGVPFVLMDKLGWTERHASDSELIRNFNSNKPKFEKLLGMFLEDKDLGRVAPDFVRGSDGHGSVKQTEPRLRDYRKLCAEIGVNHGMEGYGDKDTVWFHSSAIGLSISGSGKGYAYCKGTPDLVVDDLDNYRSSDGRSFTAFRRIDGHWYLYFDYED